MGKILPKFLPPGGCYDHRWRHGLHLHQGTLRTPLLQVWGIYLPNVRVFKPFATRLKPWYFVDVVRCFYSYLKVALNALQGKRSQAVSDKASCGRGHVALGNVIRGVIGNSEIYLHQQQREAVILDALTSFEGKSRH